MEEGVESSVSLRPPSMSVKVLQNIKDAIGNLNPEEIRRHTERPLRLFLYAHSENSYRRMEDFLAGRLSAAPDGLRRRALDFEMGAVLSGHWS